MNETMTMTDIAKHLKISRQYAHTLRKSVTKSVNKDDSKSVNKINEDEINPSNLVYTFSDTKPPPKTEEMHVVIEESEKKCKPADVVSPNYIDLFIPNTIIDNNKTFSIVNNSLNK